MIQNVQSAADLAPAYDLVVVGAGPAGLSAAIEASTHGLAVLLADENESPGGQIYRSVDRASDADLTRMGPDYAAGRRLIERFRSADLSYARRATVWSVGPADEETGDGAHALEVGISLGGIARPIAADRVILATGALERPFPFPGWTMPGVGGSGADPGEVVRPRALGTDHPRRDRAAAVLACKPTSAGRRVRDSGRRYHASRELALGPASRA